MKLWSAIKKADDEMLRDALDIKLQAELSLAFDESDLPFKVDLLDLKQADSDFLKLVYEQHIIIQSGRTN